MSIPAGAAARRKPAPVIEVADLQVHFRTKGAPVRAVDGVGFDIHENEILGLVGETGCGKSVTARSLIGLLPIPPAFVPGGRVTFRPAGRCVFCAGVGCSQCNGSGEAVCQSCGGRGCEACQSTGRPAVDLLHLEARQMRALRGARLAMIFQDPSKALNPVLTVRDQIAEVFYYHRAPELLAEFGERASRLVERAAHQESRLGERLLLKLPPIRSQARRLEAHVDDLVAHALSEVRIANPRKIMNSYHHELSGGMKQRVMIALAIAGDPDVLIADEPTTALDTTVQARILELILQLQQQRRAAVLYISHDLSVVRLVCDRVAVMYAGRVVELGAAEEVFRNPLHPYTRALLSAIPAVEHERGRLAAIKGSVPEFVDPSPCCRFNNRCPFAAPICRDTNPPLHEHEGHAVACFGYERAEDFGRSPSEMPSLDAASESA